MTERIMPITPKEAMVDLHKKIPEEVIAAFNEMIKNNLVEKVASFTMYEVKALISDKLRLNNKFIGDDHIYKCHWLDVEEIYRQRGWIVEFDKPAYNETYHAKFIFKVP